MPRHLVVVSLAGGSYTKQGAVCCGKAVTKMPLKQGGVAGPNGDSQDEGVVCHAYI